MDTLMAIAMTDPHLPSPSPMVMIGRLPEDMRDLPLVLVIRTPTIIMVIMTHQHLPQQLTSPVCLEMMSRTLFSCTYLTPWLQVTPWVMVTMAGLL